MDGCFVLGHGGWVGFAVATLSSILSGRTRARENVTHDRCGQPPRRSSIVVAESRKSIGRAVVVVIVDPDGGGTMERRSTLRPRYEGNRMNQRGVMAIAMVLALAAMPADSGVPYTVENRSIQSGGMARSFVQATPASGAADKPLVIVLHGDGGTGSGIRAGLPIETAAAGGAVFVYPNAPGGTFEYFTGAGRTREVQFVRDLVGLLRNEIDIDPARVFLAGFSGGGTMANALACRLESDEIRAVAVNAGSLYPVDNDFGYTGNGGVSCALPATMLLWGEADGTPGVSYATGVGIRNNVTATFTCNATTTAFAPSPCVLYNGCTRDAGWCSIPALGHSIWNQAAAASWAFFQRQAPTPPPTTQDIYTDALQNAWQNFSWGQVNFAHTNQPHSGALSIRFDADSFEGLSFAKPGAAITAAQFPELRFFVRGTTGNENFNLSLQTGGTLHADVPLAGFVTGGAIGAGVWREVRVRFADPPIAYTGAFERINIQDQSGTSPAAPQTIYVDTVALVAAGTASAIVFADGFE
jgi:polyhydroxybutyrate depolymerase